MHYDQDRLLTVMEVKRAQSFPDEEVLVGTAVQAFKIVGNSVDRTVSLAWGLSIREAHYGRGGVMGGGNDVAKKEEKRGDRDADVDVVMGKEPELLSQSQSMAMELELR